MKSHKFILLATTVLTAYTNAWTDSAVYKTVLPTAEPTTTSDPWRCVIANLTQYFDVPRPTGSLYSAFDSYADKLLRSCTYTGIHNNEECYPNHESLCAFSTAAPASVIPDYKLYGAAASAWWASHSSNAVRLATDCPQLWYNAMFEIIGGTTWLNTTINMAACYAEALTTSTSSSPTSGSSESAATATARPGVTGSPTTTGKAGPTSSVKGRGEDVRMWMLAGIVFFAAAVNSIWN